MACDLQLFNICRFQNSQFHHMKNGRKKFGVPNGRKGKGLWNYTSALFVFQLNLKRIVDQNMVIRHVIIIVLRSLD